MRFELPDAEVDFLPSFLPPSEADRLFAAIRDGAVWKQDSMTMFGQPRNLPRLTAWYGDPGTAYVYSGIRNEPRPWIEPISQVKAAVEAACGVSFNSVLLNRYRTGQDSMGWHADNEPEFGPNPVIASVSFGSSRTFQMKHKTHKEWKTKFELGHGSLLVMRGATQHHWRHAIPKTARPVGERINLTFRTVMLSNEEPS
jgi:alkylated DNA repair dioxygenase AlkB